MKKKESVLEEINKRVPPTAWLFVAGIIFLLIGISIPGTTPIAFIGLFIILIYVVLWVTWIVFKVNGA